MPVVDPEQRHCVQGHGAWPSLQHLLSQLVWGCNENGSLELAEQQEGHEGRASDTKAHNINPHYCQLVEASTVHVRVMPETRSA